MDNRPNLRIDRPVIGGRIKERITNWVNLLIWNGFTKTKAYKWLSNTSIGALILVFSFMGYLYFNPDQDTGRKVKDLIHDIVVQILDIKKDVDAKAEEVKDRLDIDVELPKFPVKKPEVKPDSVDNNNLIYSFSSSGLSVEKVSFPKEVDEYSFVKLTSDKVGKFYDLVVMHVKDGTVVFVDTVQTSNGAEWVFTGPPGKYSVRLSIFDPEKGFDVTTGTVEIKRLAPVPPTPTPNPSPSPTPNPQPTPPVNVPEGKYFGRTLYDVIVKEVPKSEWGKAPELADNFEAVAAAIAAGAYKEVKPTLSELAGKNKMTLGNDSAKIALWMPFFKAWSETANKLNQDKKLPNSVQAYREVYLETAALLRAIK